MVALVEERVLDTARRAAQEIDAERVKVLAGDIGERHLGLGDEDHERLRSQVTRAYHLAAIYDLAVPLTVAQRVNVDGTGNVLDLCAEAESLERIA